MSELLSRPKIGALSQGTLFSCAKAEDYEGCKVRGIIITARCDIAQSKALIYIYLPVVPLDDWINRDGRLILCDRLLKSTMGKMRNCLKDAGLSESILSTQTPSEVLEITFGATDGNAPSKALGQRFKSSVDDHSMISACLNAEPQSCAAIPLAEKFVKDRDALLKELVENRLNGFYFLPAVKPDDQTPGHVVLMRQVRYLSRAVALRVAKGISRDDFSAEIAASDMPDSLSFDCEDFAMPIGSLQSPHVEHLMQTFSTLFARIGLPDIDPKYLDALWGKQPSVGRTQNEVRRV